MPDIQGPRREQVTAPDLFRSHVVTAERLREILPLPSLKITRAKVVDRIDPHIGTIISLSPYMVMATSDGTGRTDASPRGGPAGFVKVLDERHLLIPELSGNRRADTLTNLLENPFIGIMFLIPGYEDFLRLNGRAWVIDDPDLLARAPVMGKVANLAIGVQIEEAYMHCAKAAKRGSLWQPDAWPDVSSLAAMAVILRDHTRGSIGDGSVQAIQDILDESYTKRLFTPGW